MPIVEIMGIALAACGLPVIVLQHVEQFRLARSEAPTREDGAQR